MAIKGEWNMGSGSPMREVLLQLQPLEIKWDYQNPLVAEAKTIHNAVELAKTTKAQDIHLHFDNKELKKKIRNDKSRSFNSENKEKQKGKQIEDGMTQKEDITNIGKMITTNPKRLQGLGHR